MRRVAAAAVSLQPRGLRMLMGQLVLALLALPIALIGVAEAYERWEVRREQHVLVAAAEAIARLAPGDEARVAAVAVEAHALVARLDAEGQPTEPPAGTGTSLETSPVGRVGERIVAGRVPHPLERADASLPPWPARDEVRDALAGQRAFGRHLTPDGDALLITLAEPLSGGGALYLVTGSHRGIRRLDFVRRQILQLLLYEGILAIPLVVLFGLGILKPLERLATAARRYPAATFADAELLRRRDEIGQLTRALVAATDELDRRRQAAADLGADIAHEFKNPLATIAASAELLANGAPPTAERVALVSSTIGASVERLRASIDELLRLLRIEEALPAEARAPAPLGALLREVAADYARDPRAEGWRFDVELPPALEAAAPELNRARFVELLRNLVENALVQPARRKVIVLGARREDRELAVFVRDHGPGVSLENRERIFQRFFTQRPDGAPPGAGLGLSIVDSIAAAHGARVELRSEPGEGAEFSVVLPP